MRSSTGLLTVVPWLALTLGGCADVTQALHDLQAMTNVPGSPNAAPSSAMNPDPVFVPPSPASADPSAPGTTATTEVTINGRAFSPQELAALGITPGQIQPGHYWYDARSGLWGVHGSGAVGQVPPGLAMPPVPREASGGDTGVLINGREITKVELAYVQQLVGGPVMPGRYFLDANGDAGAEGGPVVTNLMPRRNRATYFGHTDIHSTAGGGGFYDPATGDHYYSFTDSQGRTYSSGL